jgi:hypothetical protein
VTLGHEVPLRVFQAILGSGLDFVDQVPPELLSTSVSAVPLESKLRPTAVQAVALVQATPDR